MSIAHFFSLLSLILVPFAFTALTSVQANDKPVDGSDRFSQNQTESKQPPSQDSLVPPTLAVSVNLSKDASAELTDKVIQQIALTHLKTDQYPAQTDFLYQRAPLEITNVLKALGYYQPKVTSQLQRSDTLTQARFDITLGQPVRIRKIDLVIKGEAQSLSVWQQFRTFQLPLKTQAIFTHQDYSQTVSALTNIAVNEGFMDAQFTQRVFKVYPHLNAVDIYLHLDTKQAYQFGQVSFQGSQQVSKEFLARYIDFEVGAPYRQDDINALQEALIDSQYFGLIRVSPQFSAQKNQQIPIEVELEDSPKHRYEMGVGFGSDTGPRVLFGFENRLVNQFGHRYQFESLLGQDAQNFRFNYRIPGQRPAVQYWNMGAVYDATQSNTLERSLNAVSADYNYQINNQWLISPFISLESEKFSYANKASETTQTLMIGTALKNRWVNNESYPSKGFHHHAILRASLDQLVSNSQFTQLELGTQNVLSLMDFWRVHARAQTTLTMASQNQTIPATYLSLLGGEKLRGYAFESIGLQTQDGETVGARNSILASLETDYRITEYMGLGLFTDAGQVFDDNQTEDWKIGAGFGLRGYTPVGMAKLDIAWPVSEDTSPWRVHFSLGFDL